ncbi:acyltransferase family protein [bacterium]|nr:acyltransferase family protein [bacterium]
MSNFWRFGLDRVLKAVNDPSVSREELAFRIMPRWLLESLRSYFQVKSFDVENIPLQGPAIIIANHSGFAGFDALMLANEIRRETSRKPKILTHKMWFKGDLLRKLSTEFGFVEASLDKAEKVINEGNLLLFFPEGEDGNFKPSSKKYQLQEFKRGFLRLALKTGAPIFPAIVIGAEETSINLTKLSTKKLLGIPVPLPLNLIPIPVDWSLRFFPEYKIDDYSKDDISNSERLRPLAKTIRHYMQKKILTEIKKHRDLSLDEVNFDEQDLP